MFGPYHNSPIHRKIITSDENIDLEPIENIFSFDTSVKNGIFETYGKYLDILETIVVKLKMEKIKIHGVNYYGHSSGLELGSRGRIFCSTYVAIVLKPLKPIIVCFDSCYMGQLSALYEISQVKSIQYVLASPSYHPSYSILETESFGKIGSGSTDKSIMSRHIKNVSCEFQQLVKPSYRCFLVFDMDFIPELIERFIFAIKNNGVEFNKNSLVVKEDSMHDLWRATKDTVLKNIIEKTCKYACGLSKCKIVRGMTVDTRLPELRHKIYRHMIWSQYVENELEYKKYY
jgi:hypothetical protein